jgi:hypothetical protein
MILVNVEILIEGDMKTRNDNSGIDMFAHN